MVKIKRNDPCFCGSGKKYKSCCLKDSEAINISNYKYDKYLETRGTACAKIYYTGNERLNIGKDEAALYLMEFLLSPIYYDTMKHKEDFDNFLDDISFIFTIYGYPIYDLLDTDRELDDFGFDTENLEDNYLWRYCQNNFINEFTEEETKFIDSLQDSKAGFFKIIDIHSEKNDLPAYPIIEMEDIFSGKRYKLMDKSMSGGVVKHDIISGIIVPFTEDIHVLESCPPLIYPPRDREIFIEMIKEYTNVYWKKYKKYFGNKKDFAVLFKFFPVIIFLVSLDYFYYRVTMPMPKMVNYDKEEVVLSETSYRLNDRELVKDKLLKIKGIRLSEETKNKTIFDCLNEKNTILGNIILKNKKMVFQTNSLERLKKWKNKIKNIPVDLIKTDYTYLDDIQAKYQKVNKKVEDDKKHKLNIPEDEFKKIALNWWKKYYDDWIKTKLPSLSNITPQQAVMTKTGRDKVEALIEDFENFHLHINKDEGSQNNIHKYFNPDELRKRLSLL